MKKRIGFLCWASKGSLQRRILRLFSEQRCPGRKRCLFSKNLISMALHSLGVPMLGVPLKGASCLTFTVTLPLFLIGSVHTVSSWAGP